MRPSSYHDRNRYVNKPLIINNTSHSSSNSLLPHARLITNSTPSILRPTVRHSSYYYQPAIIHSRNNRSSYSSSYHHHHRNTNYSHRNTHRSFHRSRNRDRIHHRTRDRYNDDKSHNRSRSRNRNKKNKSILDNRFSNPNTNINDISSKTDELKSKVIQSRNEFFNKYQLTHTKYCKDIINVKVNNYYNQKLNPRFMIQNDDKFRNRIEQFKGLNAYPFNDFMDFDNKNNTKLKNKPKTKNDTRNYNKRSTQKSFKKKDASIFSSKGKSSMNYKFRAFKKSSQPNSFVQSETENNNDNVTRNMRNNMMRNNIHVNDDDIYIGRDDGIDMNELINGLVYSSEYQDYRIGTSNTAQNDYSQYFVDTRQRPCNFIRELEHLDRLKEYPKLRKLMQSKNEALRKVSCLTPPFYINTDLKKFDLLSLQAKFDVILVDPPWRFYIDRCPGYVHDEGSNPWTFEEMSQLRIQDVAENPSFLFLWSGSGKTLNEGRLLLKKWGYKRCEVIVWLKTNKKNQIRLMAKDKNYLLEKNNNGYVRNEYEGKNYDKSLFVRSYEHCLMGIRGQVRRSTDGHLIHANVDTDVIITESAPYGSEMKPNELYDIIERFCLGRKRLELFGCKHNLRPGWLTISNDKGIPLNSNYDAQYYNSLFQNNNNGNNNGNTRYVPSTNEIEALRPKSPVRNNKNKSNSGHGNSSQTK